MCEHLAAFDAQFSRESGGALRGRGVMTEQYFTHRPANGLEIVGQRMPGMRSVALGFQIASGAKDDPPGQAGLAHLSEYMLFQGTTSRTDRELTEAIDALGIDRDSHSDLEWSRV